GLPLRAATIFPPLSSRTRAPSTSRSHRVAIKGRVPKAAVITSASFETHQCSLFVLSCQEPAPDTVQALESSAGFRYLAAHPTGGADIPVPAERLVTGFAEAEPEGEDQWRRPSSPCSNCSRPEHISATRPTAG